MKYIKGYKIFESNNDQFFKTKEEIEDWLKKMNIKQYTINRNLTVDVYDNVNISQKELKYIPIQFRIVTNDFYCRLWT